MLPISKSNPFKWRHYAVGIILRYVRWYCTYPLSNVYKNLTYPKAIDKLKEKKELSEPVELRQNKYLNNRIEQDHRFIKWLVKPEMGVGSFNTVRCTIKGYAIINMRKKMGGVTASGRAAVAEVAACLQLRFTQLI